jgi:holin-like protein
MSQATPAAHASARGAQLLVGLSWLIAFELAGEFAVGVFRLPIPGSVLGLVFLFGMLLARPGVSEDLVATSNALLQHLTLLLVPATAGLMLHFNRLAAEWLPIALATAVGTALTMVVTALTFRVLNTRDRPR